MDFVTELPKSMNFDMIMIVVNLVLKRTHFIPVHMTVTAEFQ